MKDVTVHTLAGDPADTRSTDCGRHYQDIPKGDYIISRSLARLVSCTGCREALERVRAMEPVCAAE